MNMCAIIVIALTFFLTIFAFLELNAYRKKCFECEYNGTCNDLLALLRSDDIDMTEVEYLAKSAYEAENIIITLYDDKGDILYDSAETGHETRHNKKEYLMSYGEGHIGKLVLSSDKSYMKSTALITVTSGVIIILIMLPASHMISRRVGKPISDAVKVAAEITSGKDIDVKTDIIELENLVGAVRDLSNSIQHHEHIRKKLIQDIAHELRTPIAAIQGNLEAAIDGIWVMDEEKVKSCYDETKRLSNLVSDINCLLSYENNRLCKTSFDIKDLLVNVISSYQSLLNKKNIQLLLDSEKFTIFADKEKLTKVFINIISNALNYTPECGFITIKTDLEERGNILMIAVSDTGLGVAEEDLPYIFERFYKADKSRNRNSGGSGIGLSIVKAIVEAHSGVVTVESRLGEGTTVLLKLPCLDA